MGLVMAKWAKPRGYRVANYVLSKGLEIVFLRIIALKVLRWSSKVAKRAVAFIGAESHCLAIGP